jgi:hypothetical protein
MSGPDDETHVILIAFEVEAPTRGEARALAYSQMPLGIRVVGSAGTIVSWWHADPDHTDNHDNAEAVFVHNERGLEAGKRLHELGLTDEENLRLGDHPSVTHWLDGDGNTTWYQCDRCQNKGISPSVLVAVPCVDLSLPEHDHQWERKVVHDNGALTVECFGCDLILDEDEALRFRRSTYPVLDQNGSLLDEFSSWGLAAQRAREYGKQASVYSRDERTMAIRGERDDA